MQLLWHIFRWFCGGVVFCALQLLLTGNCHWTDLAVFSLLCIPLTLSTNDALDISAVAPGSFGRDRADCFPVDRRAGFQCLAWFGALGLHFSFRQFFGADLSQICAFMAAVGPARS